MRWFGIGSHGPAVLVFFDKLARDSGQLYANFAVISIQRKWELLTIEASGVTRPRKVRPIIVAVIVILVIALANRALAILLFKHQRATSNNFGLTESKKEMSHRNDVSRRAGPTNPRPSACHAARKEKFIFIFKS
jgi:hypothetical protein